MAVMESFGKGLLRSLRIISRNRVGFAGFILVTLIVLTSYIAPHFVPLDKTAHIDRIYLGPTAEHVLGTDYQGRDNLSQVLNGGREVINVAFLAAVIMVAIAVALGSLGALVGGYVDTLIVGLGDLVLTVPEFPLLLVLAGFIRLNSVTALALILGGIGWGELMRSIRAQVLSLKERDYVQAARSLNLPVYHLLFREIIPNMASYVIIQFVFSMTRAIYSQVGLIFLGIVPLSTHNWGVMLSLAWKQGAIFSKDSMWYLLAPTTMIVVLQFSLVSLTRSLDELFNPRLRVGE